VDVEMEAAPATVPPPTSETVTQFMECCQSGQTSQAVEVLDAAAAQDLHHAAHLMAMLVCTSSCVRAEVHVAVASKAARLAADAGNADLEVRYEAHSRLGEAFGLVASEALPSASSASAGADVARIGSDDAFAGCLDAFEDDAPRRLAAGERDPVNCERFILAHVLLPSTPGAGPPGREYTLRPRDDLSEPERIWLSRAYFARLLALDENDLVRGADPEPSSSRDVFLALSAVLGYGVDDVVGHFVDFFLWSPVEELLNTPLSLERSGLRFALKRLRSPEHRAAVDDTIIHACENTTRIGNAMLLVRLCVVQEGPGSASIDARYLGLLQQLVQAVQLRAHVVGSKAESSVRGRITARHFQGVASEAERQAVLLLAEGGEDLRAAGILAGLSSKLPRLEWHEAASVSEVALQTSRRRMAALLGGAAYKEIAPNVALWIQDGHPPRAESGDAVPPAAGAGGGQHTAELEGIQALLIAAHEHFPDTSIDTVRCLQLAEAINVIVRREREAGGEMADD
jgi:hypothetical protein